MMICATSRESAPRSSNGHVSHALAVQGEEHSFPPHHRDDDDGDDGGGDAQKKSPAEQYLNL